MFDVVNRVEDVVAKHLRGRPLAVFSILAFTFSVLRLYKTALVLIPIALAMCTLLLALYLKGKINGFITVFISLSMFFGIGSASYHILRNINLIDKLDGETALIYATVASVPQSDGNSLSFYADVDKIFCNGDRITSRSKVYTTLYGNYSLKFGDRVEFNAVCSKSYSYQKHSRYSFVSKGAPLKAKVDVLLDKKEAEFPMSIVSNLRNYILRIGDEFFDGETGMMFKALTAGDKSSYSKELADKMSIAGISHIAAVSGLHVSLLALTLYNLLYKKNRIVATVLSLALAILFALVTGASPSTVRATLMFASYIFSKMFVRENDSITSLCFSAMVLAAFNPYVVYDWGFILSFLSVLGILIFYAPINRRLRFLPAFLGESIAMTLSAQIMTLPALTNMFGKISVYSVFANIIVSVFFMVTLCMSIVFVPISALPYINSAFAVVTGILLDAVVNTAGLFAMLPFNVIYANSFNLYEHIVYYLVVAVFVFRKQIGEYLMSAVLMLCVVVLVVGTYVERFATREYTLANESLIIQNNKTVLLVQDDLYDVCSDLKENYSLDEIDYVIIGESARIDAGAFLYMEDIADVKCIYVSDEKANDIGILLAKRNGYDVVLFGGSDEDVDDFARTLTR